MSRFLEFVKNKKALGDLGSEVPEPLMKIARMLAASRLEDLLDFYRKMADKDQNVAAALDEYLSDPGTPKPERAKGREEDVVLGVPQGGGLPPEDFAG